jgi:hypothetical protein
MRLMHSILFCFAAMTALAQPPAMELQPNGFEPVTIPFPATPAERLIELTQTWADSFNRREEGFDATNITPNTITITANKENAFFYRERGEAFDHEIRYEMRLTFNEDSYTLNFVITEIYMRDRLLESDIPDFFNSEGRLKEGYEEIERSLETTSIFPASIFDMSSTLLIMRLALFTEVNRRLL